MLRPLGVTQALLDRGDQAARVRLHLDGREVVVPLSDFAVDDTPYLFLLVLRQAGSRRCCSPTWQESRHY